MAMNKRVVYILSELRASGLEIMLLNSFDFWIAQGWEVLIISQSHNTLMAQKLRNVGYEIYFLPNLRTLHGLMRYRALLKILNPDLVHVHVESMHGPLSLLTRVLFRHLPIVKTIHSVFDFRGFTRFKRRIQHSMANLAGVEWVSVSQDVAKFELENYSIKCKVIENWISPEFLQYTSGISAVDPQSIKIALIGNCSEIKRHELIISAVLDKPKFKLFHIGDESRASSQETELIEELKAKGRIECYGASDRVLEILHRIDLVAVTSSVEGFSLVLAESLSQGIPVLVQTKIGLSWATNLPGVLRIPNLMPWEDFLNSLDVKYIETLKLAAKKNQATLHQRFSPLRGVREYTELYRCIVNE